MTMRVDISHRFNAFELDAKFETEGGLTALYGASGAGKSSIINAIAGLLTPQRGVIAIDDTVFFVSKKHINIASHKRRIGYVFQEARLFPHLSVKQNLRYGKWFARHAANVDETKITGLLGLENLLHRMPGNLSGGERQRVAIGRALLSSPRLLLMDEPLASLDQARKAEIMPYILQLRDALGIPIIYVSHATSEIAQLANQVILIGDGKVLASGTAAQILPPVSEQQDPVMTVVGFDNLANTTVLAAAFGTLHVKGRLGKIGGLIRLSEITSRMP